MNRDKTELILAKGKSKQTIYPTRTMSNWSGDLRDRKKREENALKEGMTIQKYEHTLRALGIDYEKGDPYEEIRRSMQY